MAKWIKENKIATGIIVILIGILGFVYFDKQTPSTNFIPISGTDSPQPSPVKRSEVKNTGLGITKSSLKQKLGNPKDGIRFGQLDKYYLPQKDDVAIGRDEAGLITAELLGTEDNLTGVNLIGSLFKDSEKSSDTLSKLRVALVAIEPQALNWFIRTTFEFGETIKPGMKVTEIINNKMFELSFTYDESELFGNPGHVYVIITPYNRGW